MTDCENFEIKIAPNLALKSNDLWRGTGGRSPG